MFLIGLRALLILGGVPIKGPYPIARLENHNPANPVLRRFKDFRSRIPNVRSALPCTYSLPWSALTFAVNCGHARTDQCPSSRAKLKTYARTEFFSV
jgi:hypothetical protein